MDSDDVTVVGSCRCRPPRRAGEENFSPTGDSPAPRRNSEKRRTRSVVAQRKPIGRRTEVKFEPDESVGSLEKFARYATLKSVKML